MKNIRMIAAGIIFPILVSLIAGCSLFPQQQNQTRPAPVRPVRPIRPAPTRPVPMNPSPTKKTPGASTISARDLLSRITRIRQAVKSNDWAKANTETNGMATDLARYKPPTGKNVGGITDMAKFDAEYARLQVDVKAKNKTKVLDDLSRMSKMIKTGKS